MSNKKNRGAQGEAIIRRAFRRSLLLFLAMLTLAGASILIWKALSGQRQVLIEKDIQMPSVEQPSNRFSYPKINFTDITKSAGIDFIHTNGAYGERLMPETIGSGIAFIDYDNDGDQDIFLVNSTYWPGHAQSGPKPTQALYQNDGKGRFKDVTQINGLNLNTYGMGVAVGDYDNNGLSDIYLCTVGKNYLFHNSGKGFTDVSEVAGVAGASDEWSTSAAFLDYDNDGDLDLFVANYVKWSAEIDLEIDFKLTGLGRAYGGPENFIGTNNRLYRNDGDGRFSDISHSAGINVNDPNSGLPLGKALGIVLVDYDQDGWVDLFIANDTSRNFLFHNLGNGSFEEIGIFEGFAFDRDGKATSGMGIDAAYYRNDQDLGLAIGNFANEMTSLYTTADGTPPFADEAIIEGLGPSSRLALTFGVFFWDYDLDGRLDLLQANGHLEHEINRVQPSQHYAQPAQLFWNCGEACNRRFILVQDSGDLSQPLVGRASAFADIDDDGDLDLLITQNGRRPVLLRNDQQMGNHWLRIKLTGTKSNRSAIGARLALSAGGIVQRRDLFPTRSYMAQVELPVTFGLGDFDSVDFLKITWPDGSSQTVVPKQIDTTMFITQPK